MSVKTGATSREGTKTVSRDDFEKEESGVSENEEEEKLNLLEAYVHETRETSHALKKWCDRTTLSGFSERIKETWRKQKLD